MSATAEQQLVQENAALRQQLLAAQAQAAQAQAAAQAATAAAAAPTTATAAAASAAAVSTPYRPKIKPPSNYAGSALALDSWMREMTQQFTWYRITSNTERVAMACAHLSGAALDWWWSLSATEQAPLAASESQFVAALRARFQPVNSAQTARLALDRLQQGSRQSVHDYTVNFRRLLSDVPDMCDADRLHRYVQGLQPRIQQRLLENGVDTLDKAIAMAARVGSLSQFAAAAAGNSGHPSYPAHGGRSDAMDLSAIGLEGVEGLELEDTAEGTAMLTSPSPSSTGAVSRAELRQLMQEQHRSLLAAMQQRRSGPTRGGRQVGGERPSGRRRVELTEEQMAEYREAGKCFTCGQPGHTSRGCLQRGQKN